MQRIGITIDWDFFAPYNALWDMQHTESPLYLDFIWTTRGHLVDEYKTDGTEKTFWPRLYDIFGDFEDFGDQWTAFEAVVGESHATIVKDHDTWLHADTLVLFDQHHDCWPCPDDNRDPDTGRMRYVACHTWGRAWLEEDPKRKLIWVYPDTMSLNEAYGPLLNPGHESDVSDLLFETGQLSILPCKEFRSEFHKDIFDPEADTVSGVHICRSGCWVPPWLDEDFCRFVEAAGFSYRAVYDTTREQETEDKRALWDPFRIRWTADAQAATKTAQENWKQHLQKSAHKGE